jgi:hypothetical protein
MFKTVPVSGPIEIRNYAPHHLVGRKLLHQRKFLCGPLIIVGENGFNFVIHPSAAVWSKIGYVLS